MKHRAQELAGLDFSHPQPPLKRTPAHVGVSVLVIALAVAGWLAFDLAALDQRRANALATRPQAAPERPVPATLAAEIRFADESLRTSALPWEGIFTDIETALRSEISLQHLQVQGRAGEIRLSGEARHFDDLSAYLTELDKRPQLAGSQLLGHQIDEARGIVKFEALIRWKSP